MFISRIQIEGFRNFRDSAVLFNDGINVIIGHNNAGKTNLLRAIALVLDASLSTKRLEVDDFHKGVDLETLKKTPPSVRISLFFSESKSGDLSPDDLATVADWITKLESPYEARLTYEFFLPEKENGNYENLLKGVSNHDAAWRIVKRDFIRKYIYRIFGGDPHLQDKAEGESLQKFDFQFLNAIRDVERDMFTGRSPSLREVLQFFMDYEIKKDKTKTEEEQAEEIKKRQQTFDGKASPLLDDLLSRIREGKKEILDYATQTGASFDNAMPAFEGSITEVELLSALRLIIEHNGIKVPAATHNGLGYNNLIYISLLLAKLQTDADGDYYGSNAKVYPILVIEEPEAHLHPSMQYKLLRFLRENRKKKVRQVFVSTHSTHITAAVSLDEIICLHSENGQLNIGYPGRVYSDSDEDAKSKAYVERFLDATKSNILFAQRIVLVEGLAEQILMPTIARHVDMGKQLEDHHVAVCAINGRYFDHFLKLFDSTKPDTIRKRVACITDRDPERRKKDPGSSYEQCYPFEFGIAPETYEFRDNASVKITQYSSHPNIRFFSQDNAKGKTLEYDLAFTNPTLESLLTESIRNRDELLALMRAYKDGKGLAELSLRETPENSRIRNGVSSTACVWSENDKKRGIIAARYLNSVSKGENALELSARLEEDLSSNPPTFLVPQYLKDALGWLLQ